MVSEDAPTPFSVIGPQKSLPNGMRIFKLFSRQPLANSTLHAIFGNLTLLASRSVCHDYSFGSSVLDKTLLSCHA